MKKITQEEYLKNRLNLIMGHFDHIPEPYYSFEIAESVRIGRLQDAKIEEKLEDGKIYRVSYIGFRTDHNNEVSTQRQQSYFVWHEIRPQNGDQEHHFIKNDDIFIQFMNADVRGLVSMVYNFGVDFDPDYQRDYVWTDQDKQDLIASIFENVDIGKFVFIHHDWMEHAENLSYTILDGKQRLRTICDFYENKFPFRGIYFNDLSIREQDYFENFHVTQGEIRNVSKKDQIRLFLILNKSGRVMDREHLEKVEKLLNTL